MNNLEIGSVAKFGGTSMACPDIAAERLAHPGDEAEVVVVSAPAGLTDALNDLAHAVHPAPGQWRRVQELVDGMAAKCDPSGTGADIQTVIDGMPADVDRWRRAGNDIMGLGEYWSARVFAAHAGREFVDAAEVVRFDSGGQLDPRATLADAQARFSDDGRYVVPGFYGSDPEGRLHLLDRSGSDISAALLAYALNAPRLDIWSDVPGFMTANPAVVQGAVLVPEITPGEARAMYPGCELLHRDVLRFTGKAGVTTYMRNTFGEPGNVGTVVKEDRDPAERPVAGVVGVSNMTGLNLYELGSEEESGSMTDAFEGLAGWGIPIEEMATAVDDLFVTFQDEHKGKLPHGFIGRSLGYSDARMRPANAVKVVGEGLTMPGSIRTRILVASGAALAGAGVDITGCTGAPDSVSRTFFVEGGKEIVDRGVNAVHAELFN